VSEGGARSPVEMGDATRESSVGSVAGLARSANAVNALIHLYRAEVGRMTTYRVRLDTTTNWALTSSALVGTFALGNSDVTHVAFLFLMFVNHFFLFLEARRFRVYETSRRRVGFLEQHFYPEVLGGNADQSWTAQLLAILQGPPPPVSQLGALGWRLRRNYLWIYFAVLVAWLIKLVAPHGPTLDLGAVVADAAIGSISGLAVLAGVSVLYVWLVALAALARHSYPAGDDEPGQTSG
jgi:uncharacterized membrane protein